MPGFNQTLFEQGIDIINLFGANVDANTDVQGDFVLMKNYGRAYILLEKLGSEDVDDLGLEVQQAATNGGTAKAINITKCWYKTGTLTAVTAWTAVTLSTATNFLGFGSSLPTGATRVVADVDTNQLQLLVEIMATDFDVANGYKYLTAFVEGDNVNNACLLQAKVILANGSLLGAIPPDSVT